LTRITTMLLHFFSKALILLDLLLEVIFKDFKAIRNFCKSVVTNKPPNEMKRRKVVGPYLEGRKEVIKYFY